jgi:transposase
MLSKNLTTWSRGATQHGGSLVRKKQEFIVLGKQIFVGLEDSKKTWKVCVRSGGIIVHETSMPAVYDHLHHYLQNRYPGCQIQLMYEAGFGGFGLHDRLVADGIKCVVTPPHTVTQPKVSMVKTDRVDARRLAKNLESGDYRCCHVPDRQRREDRQLSRTLDQTQKMIKATKNRIRKLLDYHGLNSDLPAGAWTVSQYRQLKEMRLPSRSLQKCVEIYLRTLDHLAMVRKELLAELRALSAQARYSPSVKSKQSCPGVGWLSAIRFTLEWGELSRFPSGKHLASYAGLTCREYSTGDTIHRGHITKHGHGQVRGWLIQCAWRALKRDPALLRKFETVWRNAGSKKQAIVAVARKLVVRLRAIELTHQPYDLGVIA